MVKMPHWPIPLGSRPIDLDLSRISKLLANLDNPQLKLPPVIHIAGTNGKGSTLAFLKAIFEAADYTVHRYTSPHLVNFNERIQIAGSDIQDSLLHEMGEECRMAAGDIPVTFFEGTTAMAFLAFSRVPADVVLLETGLGGRLDATNVLDRPALTAITPISYDHMEYLGPTISTIAREKAGIMKQGVPCIISYQFPEGMETLEEVSGEVGTPLFRYGHEWKVEKLPSGFRYREEEGGLDLPTPSLPGPHQLINAGTAVACIQCLEEFDIADHAIIRGLQNATWPARMERITSGKLSRFVPEGWEMWLDGAHNEAGAHMLSVIADDWRDKPLFIINGMTKGRDVARFLTPLLGKVRHVCGVRVQSEPSALSAEAVAAAAQSIGLNTSSHEGLEDALDYLSSLTDQPARILICGSLYLAGDVRIANGDR